MSQGKYEDMEEESKDEYQELQRQSVSRDTNESMYTFHLLNNKTREIE